MTRATTEWIGTTDATSAPPRVKLRIILRQEGVCACGCGVKLTGAEGIEFDHETALILGGENRETNLRALRRPCHAVKTRQDVRQKSTEARKRAKHLGLHKTAKHRLPGSKGSGWRKPLNGPAYRVKE